LRGEEDRKRDACATLFNESQSRIIISVDPDNAERTMSILREGGVPFWQLGKVGGNDLRIRVNDETFRWPVTDLHDDWFHAIRRVVEDETERIPSL
jgi:phosphoribosylformylglycinamidine synthase subunit PurL